MNVVEGQAAAYMQILGNRNTITVSAFPPKVGLEGTRSAVVSCEECFQKYSIHVCNS